MDGQGTGQTGRWMDSGQGESSIAPFHFWWSGGTQETIKCVHLARDILYLCHDIFDIYGQGHGYELYWYILLLLLHTCLGNLFYYAVETVSQACSSSWHCLYIQTPLAGMACSMLSYSPMIFWQMEARCRYKWVSSVANVPAPSLINFSPQVPLHKFVMFCYKKYIICYTACCNVFLIGCSKGANEFNKVPVASPRLNYLAILSTSLQQSQCD